MSSPENATARLTTGPNAEQQSTGSTGNASPAIGGFTQLPNSVMLDARLSVGARLTYGLLRHLEWAQRPKTQDEIGKFVGGVGDRQVRRYLDELIAAGLVRKTRVGKCQPNRYDIDEGSDTDVRSPDRTLMSGHSTDRTLKSAPERTPMSAPKRQDRKTRSSLSDEPEEVTCLLDGLTVYPAPRAELVAAYRTHPDGTAKLIGENRTNVGKLINELRAGRHKALDTPSRIPAAAESWFTNVGYSLPAEAFEEELADLINHGLDAATADQYRARHTELAHAA